MSSLSTDEIIIRPATNRDRDKIVALVSLVLSEYGLQFDPVSSDADLNDIEKSYLERGGAFELIEDGEGNLIGTVGLYALDKENCKLRKLYFVQRARGLGLGRHALEHIVRRARELGFKKISLETTNVLKEAIRLYTRFGFQPVEQEILSPRCDQVWVLNLYKCKGDS